MRKVIVRWISFAIGEISDRSWQDGDSDVGDDEYYSGYNVSGFRVVHSSQVWSNFESRSETPQKGDFSFRFSLSIVACGS